MDKAAYRASLRGLRSHLAPSEFAAKSQRITKRLESVIDWPATKTLHTYLPIESQKEVDTWLFVRWLWLTHPSINTFTSVYYPDQALRQVRIDASTKFSADEYGIPVPQNGRESNEQRYDVIVVPMLGFDRNLHRLGYGRGLYDRFLASQPQALKIGLCYQIGFVFGGLIPDKHDQKLDYIITEVRSYN